MANYSTCLCCDCWNSFLQVPFPSQVLYMVSVHKELRINGQCYRKQNENEVNA